MVRVLLKNIRNYILRDITAEFSQGELSTIVGPNGAGKTTLLKVVAGLVPYEGQVYFDGKNMDDVPPHKRNVLYIPQKTGLFQHMKVRDNIAFCLKVRKVDEGLINEKVRWALQKLSIEHLSERYPSQLSGGEAKRVAIARALVCGGDPLLLDELESSLDAGLRVSLSEEMLRIAKELSLTLIMVTHDLDWAMGRADKIFFLWEGRMLYSGPPEDLDPSIVESKALAWLGSVLEVNEVRINEEDCYAVIEGQRVPLYPCTETRSEVRKVYVPPNNAWVDVHGKIRGRVVGKVKLNDIERVLINTGNGVIIARNTYPTLTTGENVRVRISGAVPLKNRPAY